MLVRLFGAEEKDNGNPKYSYFKACMENKVVPLPAFDKIRNNNFVLEGYKLNPGVCKAIGTAVQEYEKPINKILLSNNGLSDEMLSNIVHGFKHNEELSGLTIKQNEFGPRSLEQVKVLLQERKYAAPSHRVASRSCGCKT